MSNSKFYFLLATSSLIIFLFSCKRKNNITDEIPKSGVITATSFSLQDFVIHDAADARVLDFLDVHRIVQEADTTKVRNGAVDTLYFAVLETIDITSLKLKPRFSDLDRVVSIDPDTTQARDFSNNGISYPTMKVKFNTGLTRTFAIVVSKTAPNQNNINLLLNQHIYYLSEYKVYNDDNTNITSQTKIKLTNHLPILLQTSAEDTIEFSLVYNDVVGNNIHFAPLKYGDENTDTVITTTNPTELIFDKTNPTDLATYKTMTITFANGFVRNYAVKPIVIDNNENLNKNAYIIGMYDFKSGGSTITGLSEVQPITQHTPTNRIMQRDTIDVTVPSTFAGTSVDFSVASYGFDPATYTANDSVKTTVSVAGVANDGTTELAVASKVVTIPSNEFGNYVTITYTFSNGFKREYAVRVTKLAPPPVTIVSFTGFSVSPAGTGTMQYTKIDTTGLTINGYSLINSADSAVMIIRPLTGWTGGRTVTLNFTGLPTDNITASLSLYNTADGTLGSITTANASSNTISLAADFSNILADSVKLTLKNNTVGGEERHYKIKLLSGMLHAIYQPANVIFAAGSSRDNVNFQVSNPTSYDKELGIAVDANKVYVLKLDSINPNPVGASSTTGAGIFSDFRQGATSIIAYDISSGTGNPSSPLTVVMPPVSDSTRITAIFSVNNTLYGLALSVLKADSTAGPFKYCVYRWTSGVASLPDKGAVFNGSSVHVFTSVYPVDNGSGNIDLYCSQTGGTFSSGITANKISITSSTLAGTTVAAMSGKLQPSTNIVGAGTGSTWINTKGITFVNATGGSVYYKGALSSITATPQVPTSEFLKYNPSGVVATAPAISLIGGDIQTIRDKNYFFASEGVISAANNATGQGGAVFDFGINFTKLDALAGNLTLGNSPLFTLKVKNYPFFSGAVSGLPYYYSPYYNRGGCRTYLLSDGTVRVAYLVNGIGFQVWDME